MSPGVSHETAAAQVGIIGIPLDENSSYWRGASEAPPLIRRALYSDATNMWTELGIDLGSPGAIFDDGDLRFGRDADPFPQIESAIVSLLSRGFSPLALGGDHSITYPILRAFRRQDQMLSVLHFDAHPDLYQQYQGNRFSHACPFARIMEEELAQQLVQAGIRSMNRHQREQAERFGVHVIEMKDWRDDLRFEFENPVYVSIDLDALDPAYAPGVSHWEPGGLSPRQIISALQSLRGRIIGADLVEYNPRRDPSGMTAAVCAKLLKELAGRMMI